MNRSMKLMTMICFFSSLVSASQQINPVRHSSSIAQVRAAFALSSIEQETLLGPKDSIAAYHQAYCREEELREEGLRNDRNKDLVAMTTAKHKNLKKIVKTLESMTEEELNKYNQNGQTAAHSLTSVHWHKDVIDVAIAKHVDLTKQSTSEDLHPGSTLAHNVAGLLYHRNKNRAGCSDSVYTKNSIRCLHQLWAVDNGAHFNLLARSNSNEKFGFSVWDFLHLSGHLNEFLEPLESHIHVPRKYRISYREYYVSKQKPEDQQS
ncbi:MAG: hypothetical protein NTZ68_03695 [Candidatus Dependentiae bacterium]|nr:hypothetical protein [Candidatus Dependentiae bacterium]